MSLPGLVGEPGQGDIEAIRSFSAMFTQRSAAARARGSDAAAALSALAPIASETVGPLGAQTALLAQRFEEASDAGDEIAVILVDYADQVEALRADARRARHQAQSDYGAIWDRRRAALNELSEAVTGWALGWDDVLPSWMYFSDQSYLHRWREAIEQYKMTCGRHNALQGTRDALDARTAARLRAVRLIAQLTRNGRVGPDGFSAAALVWAANLTAITPESLAGLADPDLIREVWNSLDVDQRAAMIAAAPLLLGNLNGIPIRDRVAANRINIGNEIAARQAEIDRLTARIDALAAGPAHRGQHQIRLTLEDLIAEEQRVIDYYQSLLDQRVTWFDSNGEPHTTTGSRVVVFDPAAQAIATYHGPIDPVTGDIPAWVQHVAVSVPGTGSSMTDFSDGRGSDLYAGSRGQAAIFQWAGGPFPQSIPEATNASYSQVLAPRLRDFAAGIAVPEGSSLTVLGHSYGGATVGLAEQAGMRADRILYVSAAGMGHGVSGVADFPHTSDVPHYALMARNDMVVGLIQGDHGQWHALHGQSPLSADGVTRLETGWIDAGDPSSTDIEDYNEPGNWSPPALDSHSSVFKPGSTSFNNMIEVITGGEAVVFAENVTRVVGRSVITIDGIDVDGYEHEYVKID